MHTENTEDFGWALSKLKAGYKVRRRGWNGKNLSVSLIIPLLNESMTLPYLCMNYPSALAHEFVPANHSNARVPWLASQTDLLAEDWELAE